MCPAQGPRGSIETLYCTFSSGKTPGFLYLSGVNRAVHYSHFVCAKGTTPQLTFLYPIEKHKSLVGFVPVLQTLSRLRQVTKQTMAFGGLQSGSVTPRIWPLKLPGKFASRGVSECLSVGWQSERLCPKCPSGEAQTIKTTLSA